uniref:Putative secreted protein n=1 Tax=Ixodes ricinus TaxID=34613 RepID=A0A147BHR8_IXORI
MHKPARRRSVWVPIFIAAAIAETAAFAASYFYYRRLNHSQESRYWMYQNFKPGFECELNCICGSGHSYLFTKSFSFVLRLTCWRKALPISCLNINCAC